MFLLQMTFGLILLLMNRVYKKDWVSVINEFIPQFIFLEARSGCCGPWTPRPSPYRRSSSAPAWWGPFVRLRRSLVT